MSVLPITALIVGLIVFVTLIGLLLFALVAHKKDHLSGSLGERKASNFLNEIKKDDEILINNFLASRNKTKTSSIQIDHIFITHKGIFVIETKDYRGRIYGNTEEKYWTQVLAYGNAKNSLYNPIMQNKTHAKYIYNLLNEKHSVYSVVIFLDADISRISGDRSNVFSLNQFRKWYQNFIGDYAICGSEIVKIGNLIKNKMECNQITLDEHVRNIKRKHER